jgi:hypothetical protein
MKFNHDAEKVGDVFVGYELDEEKIKDLVMKFETNPTELLGKTKSETAEFLHSIANDPEALIVTAMVLVKGVTATRVMEALSQKVTKDLRSMDLTDMPKEMAEGILAAEDAPQELKDKIRKQCKAINGGTSASEADDEFEQLKRKYQ